MKTQNELLTATIGDLIVAVVDAALEADETEEQAFLVAGLVVNNLFLGSAGSYGGRPIRDA